MLSRLARTTTRLLPWFLTRIRLGMYRAKRCDSWHRERDLLRGTAWIISYFVLSVTVLWLAIALTALYRRTVESGSPIYEWPASDLVPGEPLPRCVTTSADNHGVSLLGELVEHGLLVVCSASDRTAYAATASAVSLARKADVPLTLAMERPPLQPMPRWLQTAHLGADHVVTLEPDEFGRLGLKYTPTIVVLRRGVVAHAVAGITNPSDAEHYLGVFMHAAEPEFTPAHALPHQEDSIAASNS